MRYTNAIPQPTPVERARFEAKYDTPELGCWEWTAAKADGYGRFRMQNKTWRAHRLLYAWSRPDEDITGVELDHYVCDNRGCIRPDHLRPTTTRENVLRGHGPSARNARKTHCSRGHKLTSENTQVDSRGKRNCRTCWRIRKAEELERNGDHVRARKRSYYTPVFYEDRQCKTCSVWFTPTRSTNWYHSPECQERRER